LNLSKIKKYSAIDEVNIEALKDDLVVLGDSHIDLYLGALSVNLILREIIQILKSNDIDNCDSFKEWLFSAGNDYRMVTISDCSSWTLRLGDKGLQFVHVHPGRESKNVTRVRSLTLKTAIMIVTYSKLNKVSAFDLTVINALRKKYLDESPLKKILLNKGLGRVILLLN
ncbi:hypothetical protein ACFLS9_07280, partial [Bacteroidota bacterium]